MLRALLVLAIACVMPIPLPQAADLVVRNARVVHGDGRVTPRATVVVRGGRIAAILAEKTAGAPQGHRNIDASGRTIIPGLIDAHVHVSDWSLPLFLRYGVTTIRDLHNPPAYILPLAREDAPDRPHIIAAGALLDGPG